MADRPYYQQKASICFNRVADILTNTSGLSFWQVGRTLNTCRDYIARNSAAVPFDVERFANEVVPNCTRFYIAEAGRSDNHQWWWDDYGWWGLAHLAVGDIQKAKDCWLRMRTYGVDTASSSADYLGGCWNHKIDQDPPGCENCVTNSTFFLLSLRLLNDKSFMEDPGRNAILAAARDWMRWFVHWQARPGAIRNPLQLMRERPVGDKDDLFARGAPTNDVGWIWTGDQGLVLAWAAEAFLLASKDWEAIFPGVVGRKNMFDLAVQIRQGMTPLFDADGVLHEAPYFPNSLGSYSIDYSTGRGVFMRYLARADDIFRLEMAWPSSDVQILRTADAVIALLEEQGPTMYSWSYPKEQSVLDTWKEKVTGQAEGKPQLCSADKLSADAMPRLVFYGIALDALTAATAVMH